MASETKDSTNQFSPLIDNMRKELIDGVVYQKWWAEMPIKEELKKLKALEVFDDDVITAGFPRSGNHWAYDVVYMIRHQTTQFAPKYFLDDLLDIRLFTPNGLEDFERPRNLVTHDRPSKFPTQAVEKGTKMIFLLRNPKDMLVSMFQLWSTMDVKTEKFEGTWEEFLELSLNGQFSHGSWFDYTLEVEKFIDNNPKIPIYVHVYEHMKENPVNCIRKLCAFLEKPDTLAEEIANAVEFNRMKKHMIKYANSEVQARTHRYHPEVLRKGMIGDWKNTFTVAQNERFNKFYKEKMRGSKLGQLIEKYLELE